MDIFKPMPFFSERKKEKISELFSSVIFIWIWEVWGGGGVEIVWIRISCGLWENIKRFSFFFFKLISLFHNLQTDDINLKVKGTWEFQQK